MDDKQFKALMDELEAIKGLLILMVSKAGANSIEIGKVLDTSDSRVRQILTGAYGKRKKGIVTEVQEVNKGETSNGEQ